MDFRWIFLEHKRISAKRVRDFLGVKCPSSHYVCLPTKIRRVALVHAQGKFRKSWKSLRFSGSCIKTLTNILMSKSIVKPRSR